MNEKWPENHPSFTKGARVERRGGSLLKQGARGMASSSLGKLSHSWADRHILQTERESIIGDSIYKEKQRMDIIY